MSDLPWEEPDDADLIWCTASMHCEACAHHWISVFPTEAIVTGLECSVCGYFSPVPDVLLYDGRLDL